MENDLISRSALSEELSSLTMTITGLRAGKGVLRECMTEYRKSVLRIVDDAPAVDAVEVVRCKDCRHYVVDEEYEECGCECCYGLTQPEPFDFCRYGERRANDEH